MEINYKNRILSILIDWYENNPAHIRGQKPSRRRIMRLHDDGQTDFPDYNIENHLTRKEINQAVLDLADKNFIDFQWMRGQKNHIIAKLWLKADTIESVYNFLGRHSKQDTVDELLLQMTELHKIIKSRFTAKFPAQWALNWLEDTIAVISRKRAIGASMPFHPSEQKDLLKTISYLADNEEIETLERVFSMLCFGDSKHFEHSIKTRLVRILKKYLAQEDCVDEEALRMAGIVSYPEQFSFSGALSIILPKGIIDFAPLPFGGTLTIDDVKQGQIRIGQNVRRVLSIENYANYVDYVHKSKGGGELVIFHGGQFSPAKRIFLQAIVSSLPQTCDFFHWGDIDYGGFRILARLRREILLTVKPWRMDKNELIKYSSFTTNFAEAYGKRIASLLDIPELSDCFPCIQYMMKSCVRLEQEAMLT